MAATPVYTTAISDQLGTLTLKLYDQAGVTVLNPGDTAAVDAAGRYTWSVSESLSGVKDYEVETAAGAKVAGGQVLLADTTEPQALDDVLGAASPIAELAQAAPVAKPSLVNAVMLLYMALRNKVTQTATEYAIHDDAGTKIATKTTADDGTTYSETEMASGA